MDIANKLKVELSGEIIVTLTTEERANVYRDICISIYSCLDRWSIRLPVSLKKWSCLRII